MGFIKRIINHIVRKLSFMGALGMGIILTSSAALANPVLGNVASGNATVQQTTNSTVVNQTSDKAILNWQSFNIGAQESTHFQQPTGGMALNRISAQQGGSQIYGTLTATGKIILVNPAGIYFGPSAYVNVGGIIATTANISDENFNNGNYQFNGGSPYGSVINDGQIIAEDHGLVALMGNGVENNGTIQANLGTVALESGDSYVVSFGPNDQVGFAVSGTAQKGVSNTGTIRANGGRVQVDARVASGVLDRVINMGGVVEARSVGTRTGDLVIDGGDTGVVYISSHINATGKSSHSNGRTGGQVMIAGGKILVDSTADIDVSGDQGGGKIFVGGSRQGKGPMPNAQAVVVASNAKLSANAISEGNGGEIVVYSTDMTRIEGTLSARGGDVSGNGGLIETSSRYLEIDNAKIDTSAPYGTYGLWLLDPENVKITAGTTLNMTSNNGNPDIFQPNIASSVLDTRITNTTLNNRLELTNVTILTTPVTGVGIESGTIRQDANAPLSWNAPTTLLLLAASDIILNGPINAINGTLQLQTPANREIDALDSIQVKNFNLIQGNWIQVMDPLPTFIVTNDFQINSGVMPNSVASFVRAISGDGDISFPYLIADVFGLQGIGSNATTLANSFVLNNNIDASVTTNWNGGSGFIPIGTANNPFAGSLDGNNQIVSDLYINRPLHSIVGLFGYANNATIKNIGVTGTIHGLDVVGLLAGYTNGTTSIDNTFSSGNVYSSSGNYATTGGLIGEADSGTISHSYSLANVITGDDVLYVGGFIGANYADISNSYSIGNVTTGNNVTHIGGFAGYNSGNISNSYATGTMTTGSGTAIGGFIGTNENTITNSFWDTDTSGKANGFGINSSLITNLVGGCFSGSCTNGGTANLSSQATYSGAGWSIGTNTNPATNTWVIINGETRPMLALEYNTSIHTAHGLQLMNLSNSTRLASFDLSNDIDLSGTTNAADIWGTSVSNGGTGWVPVGNQSAYFQGSLEGNNFTISNLYINSSATGGLGLFGGIFNGDVSNLNVSGTITGGSTTQYVGMLVGDLNVNSLANNISTSGSVTGNDFIGGIAGSLTGGITGSHNLATINAIGTTPSNIGGIAGYYSGSALNTSYNLGNIIAVDGAVAIGGIAGNTNGGTITTSYNGGNITTGSSSNRVGGILGLNQNTATVSNTYNYGTITAGSSSTNIGGLVGSNTNSSLINSYNSGIVNATGATVGAVIGNYASGTLTNNFWDSETSNQASGIGNTSNAGVTAKTTAQMMDYSTFNSAAWNITRTPSFSNTAPNFAWYSFDGSTRPMLMMEYKTSITNAHELQMIGTTLGADYTLANDIDLTSAMNNVHDVWATNQGTNSGTGFAPIAGETYDVTNFFGVFDGNDHTISNLFINLPTSRISAGLFGDIVGGTIKNITLTNATVFSDADYTGILVGWSDSGSFMDNNTVSNSTLTSTSGRPCCSFYGGMIGAILGSGDIVDNARSINNTINTSGIIGGLSSYNAGTVTNSFTSGSINSTDGFIQTGGFIANNAGTISNSASTVAITTSTTDTGIYTGGFAALNSGTINTSYYIGNISLSTGIGSYAGGFIGSNDASGSINNAYSLATINQLSSGSNYIGGFAGNNSSTITNSFSSGYLAGVVGTTTGGFIANASGGTATNSFWDVNTSGIGTDGSTSGSAGGTGKSTANLFTQATFTGWDFSNTWSILGGNSYPYLTVFYPTTPRAISGSSSAVANTGATLAVNGSITDSTTVGANGSYYFLEGNNQISGIDSSIADAAPLLVYLANTSSKGNVIALAPTANGSINGLNMTLNTVTAGHPSTSSTLNNTNLLAAKGSLVSSDILYSGSAPNLIISSGINFNTTAATNYSIDGSISATNGSLTFSGPIALTSASPTLQTTTSGDVIITDFLDANGNSLIINTAGTNSYITGDILDATNTNFTKNGSGSFTIAGNNNATGTTTVNGGTLQIGDGGTLGTLGLGAVNLNNSSSLIFNRSDDYIVNNAINGAGTLTQNGTGTIILTANNGYTGQTTINAGTLQIGNGGTTGSLGSFNVVNNASLLFNRSNAIAVANAISGTGSLTQDGSGVLTLLNTNSYTGATIIIAGTLQIGINQAIPINSDVTVIPSATLDLNGYTNTINTLAGSGFVTLGSGSLSTAGAGSTTYSGVMSGTGSFSKGGGGTLTFTGNNTYAGGTTIAGGVLSIQSDNNLGDSAGTLTFAGGTLNLLSDINSGTSTRDIVFASGGGTIDLNNFTAYLDGNISGSSAFTINSTGGSGINPLVLSGNGTYSGSMLLSPNVYVIATTDNALGINNAVTVQNGATLQMNGITSSNLLNLAGEFIGNGQNVLQNVITLAATATVNIMDGETQFNNTVQGAGGVVKSGIGTLSLNNVTNTYLGATAIQAGTLEISALDLAGNPSSIGTSGTLSAGLLGDAALIYNGGTDTTDTTLNIQGNSLTITLSNPGTLTWNGAINGAGALAINGTGNLVLGGLIGNTTPIASLTSDVITTINTSSIKTVSSQIYNNPVTLGVDTTLEMTGASGNHFLTFGNGITGNKILNLVGGSGSDAFTINGTISLDDLNVTGGAGVNTLALNVTNSQDWSITGIDTGVATVGNIVSLANFTNIQNLTGGSGNDTFTLNGGTLTGTIDGGGGSNTLIADNVVNTWNINGTNAGSVTGVGSFTNINNLNGRDANDTFIFANNGRISGSVDGGTLGNTTNTLNYQAYMTKITIYLPTLNSGYAYNASQSNITTFNNINRVQANPTLARENILLVPGTFNITFTAPNSGTVNNSTSFSGFSLNDPSIDVSAIMQQATLMTPYYINPIAEWMYKQGTLDINLDAIIKNQQEDDEGTLTIFIKNINLTQRAP